MQLPIDIKALIDEATDINAARQTELAASVYIDGSAPGDLVAHVRGAFASTVPTLRMAISYLDDSFAPHAADDFAVIVAGESKGVGPAATVVRAMGVPVMVVTTSPSLVKARAEEVGHAIPEDDVIAPAVEDDVDCESAEEPVTLDEEAAAQLDERMGRWVVAVCHEKRLAMSIAFPFMRRSLAKDAVQATSLQNAGIGLAPLLPSADLPIMTLNQAKMVLQIAAAYGHEMNKDRAKELAGVVGGAYLSRMVARGLVEFVPVLGFVIKPSIAYGGTAAVGYAAIEYFEGGEDVAGVVNVATRAASAGSKIVAKVRQEGPAAIPGLWEKAVKANDYIPVVRDKVNEYLPVVREMAGEYGPKVVAAASSLFDSLVSRSATAK